MPPEILRIIARDLNRLLKASGRWANYDATWGRTTADLGFYPLVVDNPRSREAWIVQVAIADISAYLESRMPGPPYWNLFVDNSSTVILTSAETIFQSPSHAPHLRSRNH